MTTYYLRKLFRDKQAQMIWTHQDLETQLSLDVFFEQVNNGGTNTPVSLEVLDHCVMLHQSLITTYDSNSPEVLDIESKIYQSLGVKRIVFRDAEDQTLEGLKELSPDRCSHLLKQLNELRKRCESLIGPKITTYYLPKLIREKQAQLNSESSIQSHIMSLDTLFSQMKEDSLDAPYIARGWGEQKSQEHQSNSGSSNTESSQKSECNFDSNKNINIQYTQSNNLKNSKTSNSKTLTLKRVRDLVKQLNMLLNQQSSLIGENAVFECLQDSRPDNNWCLMFHISEAGSISYSGDLREIITITRLKIFERWTTAFIQKCESYQL